MAGGKLLAMWLALLAICLALLPAARAEDKPLAEVSSCYPVILGAPAWLGPCIRQSHFFADTCAAIARYAARWRLPPAYFARLIWQESRFDPHALSVAGAEGIAQFIPSTAKLRGLRDSFDPAEALAKSAEYLAFLDSKFGNLGLAAAAYNGGEGRVGRYVAGGGYLPWETRSYVEIITGAGPDAWLAEPLPEADYALSKDKPFAEACVDMASVEAVPRLDRPFGTWKPWGVMLAQQFTRSIAISHFERVQAAHPKLLGGEELMLLMARNPSFGPRPRYFAMIGRETREAAEELCGALRKAGGACVVRRN